MLKRCEFTFLILHNIVKFFLNVTWLPEICIYLNIEQRTIEERGQYYS